MRNKILQIIPADGWVVRGRLDLRWRNVDQPHPEHLSDSHIVTHDPVVCFALMEHPDGDNFVEPMVSAGDTVEPLYKMHPDLNTDILRDDRTGWVQEPCECTTCEPRPENFVRPVPDDKEFFSRKHFSTRVLSCLENDEIDTVQKICQMTERDVWRIPNFGRKSVDELKNALSYYGLQLKLAE
ncbi:MAG: hypothetical protein HQL87_05605 [Magnetococcales bacterium]|nr:hypothetical protein [Magnetococcales bacterium]